MSVRRYNPERFNLCDECPRKYQQKIFKNATEEIWQLWFGETGMKKFKFEKMQRTFYKVKGLEDANIENLSVKTASLLGIYISEKNRAERIKDLNKPTS